MKKYMPTTSLILQQQMQLLTEILEELTQVITLYTDRDICYSVGKKIRKIRALNEEHYDSRTNSTTPSLFADPANREGRSGSDVVVDTAAAD